MRWYKSEVAMGGRHLRSCRAAHAGWAECAPREHLASLLVLALALLMLVVTEFAGVAVQATATWEEAATLADTKGMTIRTN